MGSADIPILELMKTQFKNFEDKQILRDEVQKLRHEATEKRFATLDQRINGLISTLKWTITVIVAIAAIGIPTYLTIFKPNINDYAKSKNENTRRHEAIRN